MIRNYISFLHFSSTVFGGHYSLYLEAGELIGLRFCGGTVRAFVYSINVLIVVNSHGQAVNTQAQLVLPEVNYLC